ncbi:uncharacterized protein LOC144172800 isoform X4 [Haemaphysalis longicornis]
MKAQSALMPRVSASVPESCVMAMSRDADRNWDVSCCRKTQATITSSATGTQCALVFHVSTSSQTEEEFLGATT